MKIYNINNSNEYPENYDFLTQEQKSVILNYFKYQQELADTYYEKHIIEPESHDVYLKLYNHVMDIMCGAKEILAQLGVMVEFNWPHSPGKWDFATRQNAIDRENNGSFYDCNCGSKQKVTAGRDAWPTPKQK